MNRLALLGVIGGLTFTHADWLAKTAPYFNDRVTVVHDGLEIAR